jgi:hypothetical protein
VVELVETLAGRDKEGKTKAERQAHDEKSICQRQAPKTWQEVPARSRLL